MKRVSVPPNTQTSKLFIQSNMFGHVAAWVVAAFYLLTPMVVCEKTLTGTITGYGSTSNDPVGSNQVCCGLSGSEHSATYDDPGTCASDNSKYPVNTKIYIPVRAPSSIICKCTLSFVLQGLQKYFIVQDSCADCVNQAVHFDLWMGPNSYTNNNNLLSCAESGGTSGGTIILDPGPGYTVDSTPLLDSSGKCDPNVDYSKKSLSGISGGIDASPSSTATTMTTSMLKVADGPTGVVKGKIRDKSSSTTTAFGNGGTGSVGGGSCDWEGHCEDASCQTYNDCGDPLSCIGGKCT